MTEKTDPKTKRDKEGHERVVHTCSCCEGTGSVLGNRVARMSQGDKETFDDFSRRFKERTLFLFYVTVAAGILALLSLVCTGLLMDFEERGIVISDYALIASSVCGLAILGMFVIALVVRVLERKVVKRKHAFLTRRGCDIPADEMERITVIAE